MLGLVAALAASAAFAQTPDRPPPESPFSDWSAVVVAGDWRSGDGRSTEAFDNARRDVAATLMALGFRSENLTQFSTRPDRYGDPRPQRLTARSMLDAVRTSTARVKGGCLIYYTSHGNPNGLVLDVQGKPHVLSPGDMGLLVDEACAGRPAIVIISACFSGVFLPYLQGPQRMVVTAARRDRSSFGCSTDDVYPVFDDCFLQSVSQTRSFPALPPAIQACVARRETDLGLEPPSEPQAFIGPELRLMLSMMPFPRGAAGVRAP
ncbi:MAG: C13 family peptidase [Caulobacter sp.]|nr:C13 family peptidase [Caulobacter sp.]